MDHGRLDYVKFDDTVTVALVTREQAMEGECLRIRWASNFYGFVISYKSAPNSLDERDVHQVVIKDSLMEAFREASNWAMDYLVNSGRVN